MIVLTEATGGSLVSIRGEVKTIHFLMLIPLLIKCIMMMLLMLTLKLPNMFLTPWTAKVKEI